MNDAKVVCCMVVVPRSVGFHLCRRTLRISGRRELGYQLKNLSTAAPLHAMVRRIPAIRDAI